MHIFVNITKLPIWCKTRMNLNESSLNCLLLLCVFQAFKGGYCLPNQYMPDLLGTPKSLSAYLRFGCLSVRRFYWKIHDTYSEVRAVSLFLIYRRLGVRPVFISSRLPNIPLFELSRWQIIQLICVFIIHYIYNALNTNVSKRKKKKKGKVRKSCSSKLQLAGYLVEIIILRYLGLVCKISRYLSGAFSLARRLAL